MENNDIDIVVENQNDKKGKKKKKEKKKLTISEKIMYTFVTIVTFIIIYSACEILVNGQTWYKVNIDTKEMYSLSIGYLDGDELYDKMIYFDEVYYKPETKNIVNYIDNRTPHNVITQLIMRYEQKLDKFINSFSTNNSNYANNFRLTLMNKDEIEYDVIMTKKNQKEVVEYLKGIIKDTSEGQYELN